MKSFLTNILAHALHVLCEALCFIACIIYFEARIYGKRGPNLDTPKYPLERLRFSLANPLIILGGECEGISLELFGGVK